MPAWVTALFKPVADVINKRQERKMAKEAAKAKLSQAKADDAQELNLNKDEYEAIATAALSDTWKDEYVTLSVVSILNIIVVGGIMSAYGHPQLLQGVAIAITSLVTAGVDIGFLMTAAVMAGLGLSVWKKI